MNISRDQWLARCAVSACVASRWASCSSLGVTLLALCCLFFLKTPPMAEFAIAISTATGAAQVYLASRVEFERVIFEGIASAADASAAASGFDAAAQEGGLSGGWPGRELAQRIAGLLMLTNAILFVFLFQFLLLLAAGWISR